MTVIDKVVDIIEELYRHNWDERNGGNLSYILTEEEVEQVCNPNNIIREFKYDFDLSELIGKYFIITGTGKYFRNCLKDPETNLGIMKVSDEHTLSLIFGI